MEQTEYGNGLTLAEATVLLCLDDKGWFGRSENIVKFAIAAALLYELFRLERIVAGPEGIRVVKPEPTGDPLLDRALERIGSSTESRNITGWIQEIAYRKLKLRRRILAGLIRRKIIAKKEYRILRVFVFKKFPLLDSVVKWQIQDHLCQVANGKEKPAG
ncbi:MAG TPA: GPP34 family phosphoprotein, partial [Bacteroidales bacterium]|nr:GPP34 family phosphoprotein [Bacteroidales bacterium]